MMFDEKTKEKTEKIYYDFVTQFSNNYDNALMRKDSYCIDMLIDEFINNLFTKEEIKVKVLEKSFKKEQWYMELDKNEQKKILENAYYIFNDLKYEDLFKAEHYTNKHTNNNIEYLIKRVTETFKSTSSFLCFEDNEIKPYEWTIDKESALLELSNVIEYFDDTKNEVKHLMKHRYKDEDVFGKSKTSQKMVEKKYVMRNYFAQGDEAIGVTEDLKFMKTSAVSVVLGKDTYHKVNKLGFYVKTMYPDLYIDSQEIDYNIQPTIAKVLSEEKYEPNRIYWLMKMAGYKCKAQFVDGTENCENKKIHKFYINSGKPNDENEIYDVVIEQYKEKLTYPRVIKAKLSIEGKIDKETKEEIKIYDKRGVRDTTMLPVENRVELVEIMDVYENAKKAKTKDEILNFIKSKGRSLSQEQIHETQLSEIDDILK